MNPETPKSPRDELEQRLTALLLGELSAEETAALHRAMEQDAELAQMFARLHRTVGLVREAVKSTAEPVVEPTAPRQLSAERREKLLAHFKTIKPPEFAAARRDRTRMLVAVAAVVVICGSLAMLLLPALSKGKSRSARLAALPQEAARLVVDEALERGEEQVQFRSRSSLGFSVATSELAAGAVHSGAMLNELPMNPPDFAGEAASVVSVSRPGQSATTIVLPEPEATAGQWFAGGRGGGAIDSMGRAPVRFGTEADSPTYWARGEGARKTEVTQTEPSTVEPEWAGVLSLPASPQSHTNAFVGRYAYGVLPTTGAPAETSDLYVDRNRNPAIDPATGLAFEPAPGQDASRGEGVKLEARTFSLDTDRFYQSLADAGALPPNNLGEETRRGFLAPQGSAGGGGGGGGQSSVIPRVNVSGRSSGKEQATDLGKDANLGVTSSESTLGLPGIASTAQVTTETRQKGITLSGPATDNFAFADKPTSELDIADNNFFDDASAAQPPTISVNAKFTKAPPAKRSENLADSGLRASESRIDVLAGGTVTTVSGGAAEVPTYGGKPVLGQLFTAGAPKQPPQAADGLLVGGVRSDAKVPARTEEMRRQLRESEFVADEQRLYAEKKRELEDLTDYRRLLTRKINTERTDLSLPKSARVEIIESAETGIEPQKGALGKLRDVVTGKVERVARLKVERNKSDIEELAGNSARMNPYDPYFLGTDINTIQSEVVLSNVVTLLELDKAWANQKGTALKKTDAIALLRQRLDVKNVPNTTMVDIHVRSDEPEEAAKIANAVAGAYKQWRSEREHRLATFGIEELTKQAVEQDEKIRLAKAELEQLREAVGVDLSDAPTRKPATNAPIPQPEIQTSENAFSTFSLNVSDVSFKLAAASLEQGQMPDAASVRSEEFINAFDYRDPEPVAGAPIAFAWERARYPFAHNRDLLRFSLKTAALGRPAGRPLNLVLLLDNSGSMERADRVRIISEALRVLSGQLQPQDKLSVITFARTARLVVDGIAGNEAGTAITRVSGLTPQGGTNLEGALDLAYETAARHYLVNGMNRVVLLTDGAANLGDVEPASLKRKVEISRQQGIAFDCFGVGWEGFNDDLLETLSRNGDGRYGFINSPEAAASEFAGQLAGALQVAASDVKVQVEFNPQRVTSYRQIGYAKHQLTKEQFRDNTVDAAEIAAQEAGNALYAVEINPNGSGSLATVRVRYKVPGTTMYREQAWDVPYLGAAPALEQSSPALRLAAGASAFSEWLVASPFASEVTPDALLGYLRGVPEAFGADSRPKKLEGMIRQAQRLTGK